MWRCFFILLAAMPSCDTTTTVPATQPEGPKKEAIPLAKDKWNLSYIEKLWGLTLKDVRYVDMEGASHRSYKLLLEFTRDLKEEEQTAVRQALHQDREGQINLVGLQFYFFDSDKVVRDRERRVSIDG